MESSKLHRYIWWLFEILAGVLLVGSVLLFAWAVKKPWLPGYLDLRLRGVWFPLAFLGLVASGYLIANLWEVRRGRFRWYAEGLVSVIILFILWAILWPVTVSELHPASYAKLQGRNLRGADLCSYSFAYANLRGADLTDADLRGTSFWSADLTGAVLAGAKLQHARLWHVRAIHADLTRANLGDAVLHAAILKGARLHDANLRNARLDDLGKRGSTDLRGGADLRDADLTGADLRGATMQGANLTGARYDVRTRWPAGFNPPRHGAALSEGGGGGRDARI